MNSEEYTLLSICRWTRYFHSLIYLNKIYNLHIFILVSCISGFAFHHDIVWGLSSFLNFEFLEESNFFNFLLSILVKFKYSWHSNKIYCFEYYKFLCIKWVSKINFNVIITICQSFPYQTTVNAVNYFCLPLFHFIWIWILLFLAWHLPVL